MFPECQKRRIAQPFCFLICHSCLKSMFFFFFIGYFCFFSNLKLPTERTKKDFFKGHCEWADNRAFPKKGYFLNELTILFGGISEKLV